MIRAVALDLEGTIVDIEWAHWHGHLAAAREVGIELTLEGAIAEISHFVGGPDEKIAEEIAGLAGDMNKAEDILVRDKHFFWEALEMVKVIEPRPGFLRAFRDLKDAGFTVTIGSLTESKLAEIILMKSGLSTIIPEEHIVLREGVEKLKPAPDVYQLTARIAGVDTKEQLVFEDSANGVAAAKNAGSNVVAIPISKNPKFLKRLIDKGAKRIFFEWNEVCLMDLIRNIEKEEGGE